LCEGRSHPNRAEAEGVAPAATGVVWVELAGVELSGVDKGVI
jgi:hypothetical protein